MISGDGIDTSESPQIGGPGVEATLMWYGPDLLDNPTAKDAVAELKAKDVDPEGRNRLIRRRWREPRIRT
jgi:branched-chain amino acid transport system substrate-binding protein